LLTPAAQGWRAAGRSRCAKDVGGWTCTNSLVAAMTRVHASTLLLPFGANTGDGFAPTNPTNPGGPTELVEAEAHELHLPLALCAAQAAHDDALAGGDLRGVQRGEGAQVRHRLQPQKQLMLTRLKRVERNKALCIKQPQCPAHTRHNGATAGVAGVGDAAPRRSDTCWSLV
jgi:hypothetical protein